MRKTVLALAVAMTATGAANAQDLLAFWNFNNTNNDSDRLNINGDANDLGSTFVHMFDSNDFEDGWYDPANGRLYPVQDGFDSGLPGALIQNVDPGLGSQDAESVFIDVLGIVGDGEANATPGGDWGSFSGTTDNEPGATPFFGGSLSIQGSGNNGGSFIVNADLTGWTDINVSWANRGTGTGFASRVVELSTDGVVWTPVFSSLGALSSSWVVESVDDLGNVLSDSPTAMIRFTIDGATSDSGNNRFDNIVLRGTIIPEPGTVALTLLAGSLVSAVAMRSRLG